MKFEDDLDAAAALGWGPEALDKLTASGVTPGAFAEFRGLDEDARALVLRMLDSPSEADHAALAAHPAGRALAQWLLTLPAYVNASYDDESAAGDP